MPSPFPGMDPYLEGSLWQTVHAQLIAEIARQLAPKIRPRYLALTTERVVLAEPEGVALTTAGMHPDVGIVKTSVPGSLGGEEPGKSPVQLETIVPEAVPHFSVEIRDAAHRQLVTAIEVLSPTNKRGDGRDEYLRKRSRLLRSSAHLMEVDLLRQGQRVPMREPLPSADYFVLLSRVEKRPIMDVWPLSVAAPLPVVPVPLLPGDADVALDLQLAFTTIYDLVGYDLAIDYRTVPEVPLSADQSAWARAQIDAWRQKNGPS